MIFDNGYEDNVTWEKLDDENIKSSVISIMQEKLPGVDLKVSVNDSDVRDMILKKGFLKVIRYSLLGFLSFHKTVYKKVAVKLNLNSDQNNILLSFNFEGFIGNSYLFEKANFNKQNFQS